MQRILVILVLICTMSGSAFAQKKNQLIGVWQQVVSVNSVNGYDDQIVLTQNGKVFLPDGRVLGYHLNPTDFLNYEKFDFKPWFISDYQITSDSTYTEKIPLHENPEWVGTINFKYKFLNSRAWAATYVHTNPDGTKTQILDLWVKVVYDKKELKAVLKKVRDNYDAYIDEAKKTFVKN